MFGRKKTKTVQRLSYDPDTQYPVIRCSICNGEQVGGIRDRKTGLFEEIMLIRDDSDLRVFEEMAGRKDIPKEY